MVTLTTPDVNTLLVNFPTPGNEMVVENEDGSYTILINAKLSQDGQLKAYQHALNHINNEDFEKSEVQSEIRETAEKTAGKRSGKTAETAGKRNRKAAEAAGQRRKKTAETSG